MKLEEYEQEIAEANAMREEAGMDPLPRLAISFSGGRTSAVMTKRLWDAHAATHHIKITFANTGQEHPATLDFVHQCENHFGWPVVWLEAVVHPQAGKGVTHKVVNYDSACRDGSIFEAAVAKSGIFNSTKPSCTRVLKQNVIEHYLKSGGWAFGRRLNHKTAIGIRADEVDRVSMAAQVQCGAIYPMVDWGVTKRDVAIEIKSWPFDLQIPGDHFGNCTWCWKKSKRKLMTLALEDPSVFDVPAYLEEKYGHIDAERGNKCADENGRSWFFRGHKGAKDIIHEAQTTDFARYSDDPHQHAYDYDPDMDYGSACGESCEAYADID